MMKEIFKKEVIIAFIIGIILASSIAVYAYSYAAKDIGYTKPGTTTTISVETALNELYNKTSDEYANKIYIQTGLSIYDDRVTILSGGYYVDDNNVTYVDLKLKTKINLTTNTSWLLIYGLPTSNSSKCITDTEKNLMFRVGDYENKTGRIDLCLDYYSTEIPKDTEFTIQYKY